MKLGQPWERRRLSSLLEAAVSREAQMWAGFVSKRPSSQDTDISPAQRDEAVRWLTELHGRLHFYPETLVLAVSILDRFLAPIKARPKYLRCIAIACFFLGAKTCEEDERVPSLRELAVSSGCGCSPSEILRMERLILDKLNWDLHTATALDFLHIFHAMVLSCRSGSSHPALGLNRSQHLALLTLRLYRCLADHILMQLRGSMLALALITLELETCCPDWLVLTIDLLKTAQIDSSELIRSRELVYRSLSTPRASLPPNAVYIYQSSTPEPPRPLRPPESPQDHPGLPPLLSHPRNILHKVTLRCKASAKRKVEEMEVDNIYDGIKRLYNEDITNATAAVPEGALPALGGAERAAGRSLDVCGVPSPRQEGNSSPCPPLQPVSAS